MLFSFILIQKRVASFEFYTFKWFIWSNQLRELFCLFRASTSRQNLFSCLNVECFYSIEVNFLHFIIGSKWHSKLSWQHLKLKFAQRCRLIRDRAWSNVFRSSEKCTFISQTFEVEYLYNAFFVTPYQFIDYWFLSVKQGNSVRSSVIIDFLSYFSW